MAPSFILSPKAKQDYEEIWDYIAKDDIDAADAMIDIFDNTLATIAKQQDIGHRETALGGDIRSLPVGRYILFYRKVNKNVIQIVRVIHGARDIPSVFKRVK